MLDKNGGRLRRDAIRDGIRRDEERDEIDAAARASVACVLCCRLLLYGYISISSSIIYIYHSLLGCFLSSHHSYQFLSLFNSFKDFPRPLLRALPHLRALGLFPRPRAWEERVSIMVAWRAWMMGAGGNTIFVPLIRLPAHSLLADD